MAGMRITSVKPSGSTEETIPKLVNAFAPQATGRFVVGTQIQDNHVIQVTSDWSNNTTVTAQNGFEPALSSFGDQESDFTVALDRPAFGPNGVAEAKVLEFAQSWFPASQVTTEFKRKVEEDFERFDELFKIDVAGNLGFSMGWATEEQEHQDVNGEKTKSFIVVRGWETMSQFERSVQTENFKEAIQILYAWSAPFKMVRLTLPCIGFLILTSGTVACRAKDC